MRNSLTTKYAISILGLIVAIVTLLMVATFYHSKKMGAALTESSSDLFTTDTLNQIRDLAESHANSLSTRLVNPLYYLDMDQIKTILAETLKQKKVVFVYVYDTNCRVVHDGTKEIPLFGAPLPATGICNLADSDKNIHYREFENVISVARPIRIGDALLGGVTIGLSLADIHQNLDAMQRSVSQVTGEAIREYTRNIVLITVALMLLGVLLSLIVSREFVKPIKEMIQYVKRVGEGEYDVQMSPPTKDEIGKLYASFSQMTTDLKASTVSVEKLKEEIRQRIRAEAERNEMADQLQRSHNMEAIGRLASGVAHDLNNMLSGIVSYPELLLKNLPPDHRLRQPLQIIQKSGQNASAMVQDLLTLARRSVSNTETVNFRKIVEEYLASPEFDKLMSRHADISVHTDFNCDFQNLHGKSVQLSKVVMNLMNNAVEAMPTGGRIQLTMASRMVDKPIYGYDRIEPGEYILFSVQDTGIGIEKNDLEHIFEPFYTKKVMGQSGTGLGMAVVWGALKDHDGYIDIDSVVGEGSRFDLYLPVSKKEVPKEPPEIGIDELKGNGETILVVDDVAEQREIVSGILEHLGYRATTAESGEAAIDYLGTHSVDLLILDMIMAPGIDGCETYRRVIEIHPGQKAIITSGYSESGRVKQAMAMGVGCYLRKPYTLEKIALSVFNQLYPNG